MSERKKFKKSKNGPKHIKPKPKPAPKWYEVVTYSGINSTKTAPFEIWKNKFRFRWHVSGEPGLRFIATLRHRGEEIHEHRLINAKDRSSGEMIIEENGDLYFDIRASAANWSVKIEQEER